MKRRSVVPPQMAWRTSLRSIHQNKRGASATCLLFADVNKRKLSLARISNAHHHHRVVITQRKRKASKWWHRGGGCSSGAQEGAHVGVTRISASRRIARLARG